jgi:NAD(P)-dependent dehydrogenase (short-subunit alcohol dehydrogenase family)
MELHDAVAVITGASRGLGLAIARELATQGARLVLCARDADRLEAAAAELRAGGTETLVVPCDVADPEAVDRLVARALDAFGRIDLLVANAGEMAVGPIESQTREDFAQAIGVMLWGVVHPALAVLPSMQARGSGTIVVISSIGGKVSVPHLLPYSTAKFGATGFAEGLRAEVVKDGVRVVTVIPGLMRTGSPRNAWFKGRHRAEYAWFVIGDSLPLLSISARRAARRIVEAARRGQPELILTPAAHLAVRLHGLAPGLVIRLFSAVNRLLPGPPGPPRPPDGTSVRRRGADSESAVTASPLTWLTRRAAARYRQGG